MNGVNRTLPGPDPGSLESRLDHLAARCRQLQTAVSALAVVLAVLVAGGADALQRFKSIETEQLVLRDPEGRKRGWLGVGKDGNARLSIFDRQEKELVMLGVAPDGGTLLFLTGPPGERAVTVGVDAEGVPRVRAVRRREIGGLAAVSPQVRKRPLPPRQGGATIAWPRPSPRRAARSSTSGMAPRRCEIGMGGAPDGGYSLLFLDPDGNQRLSLGLSPDPAPRTSISGSGSRMAQIGLTATEDGNLRPLGPGPRGEAEGRHGGGLGGFGLGAPVAGRRRRELASRSWSIRTAMSTRSWRARRRGGRHLPGHRAGRNRRPDGPRAEDAAADRDRRDPRVPRPSCTSTTRRRESRGARRHARRQEDLQLFVPGRAHPPARPAGLAPAPGGIALTPCECPASSFRRLHPGETRRVARIL